MELSTLNEEFEALKAIYEDSIILIDSKEVIYTNEDRGIQVNLHVKGMCMLIKIIIIFSCIYLIFLSENRNFEFMTLAEPQNTI